MFENIFGIHEQALMVQGQRMGVLAANLALCRWRPRMPGTLL
jgi:flagellar basal body rod protein FlgB